MSSTTPTTPNRILLPRRSNFGSGTYLCNNNSSSAVTSPSSSSRRASIAPSTLFPSKSSSCNTTVTSKCGDNDPAITSHKQEKSSSPTTLFVPSTPDQSLEKKCGGFLRSRNLFSKTKSSPLFSSCVSESDFDQDVFSHRPKKKEQQEEIIKTTQPNYFTNDITTDDENEFEKQTTNYSTTPTRITNNIRSIEKAFEELENAPTSSAAVNTINVESASDNFDNDYTEEDDISLILNTSTSTTMTNSSVLSSDEQTPTSLSNSLFLSSFSSTVSSLEAAEESQSFASMACSSFTFGSEQHNKETTDTLNSRANYLRRHSNIVTAPLFTSTQTSNPQSLVNIPSTVHMNSDEWKLLLISCLSTVNNDQSTLVQLKSLLHERFNNVIRQRQEFRCFLRCISFPNYYNCTLMHIAAKFGQIDTLKFLYKECPELLLQRDSRRFTPLFYLLLEDENFPITLDDKKKGETCKQICEFLWKWTFGEAFSKCYLLGKPRFQDMKKKFHKCLTQQISLDFSTTDETPIMVDVFFESLKQGKLSICRNLIEYGLDINECPFDHTKQTSGNIPFFHKTCIELPLASILFLVRHGANALKMDSFNNLPFTYLVGRVENDIALLPQVIKFMKQRFDKYQVPQHYSKLLVKLSFIQNQNMRSLLFSCVKGEDFESALFLIEQFNAHIDDSPDSPLWVMLKDANKVNVLDLLKKQMNDPGCMNNTHFSEIVNLLENLLK